MHYIQKYYPPQVVLLKMAHGYLCHTRLYLQLIVFSVLLGANMTCHYIANVYWSLEITMQTQAYKIHHFS